MNDLGLDKLTEILSVLDKIKCPILLSVSTVSISALKRFTLTAKFLSINADQSIDLTASSNSS